MQSKWMDSYVMVGGDKFHYTRTGQGDQPVVVLLHGFSDNGMCWMPVVRELEAKYDLIMPDARGHELSVGYSQACRPIAQRMRPVFLRPWS